MYYNYYITHHQAGSVSQNNIVKILLDYYKRAQEGSITTGPGDSFIDLPLLQNADYPVLVQKEDGSCEKSIRIDNLIKTDGTGPAGWNREVMKLIRMMRVNK